MVRSELLVPTFEFKHGRAYEMVAGSLSDAIVYDCKNKKSWYVEDLTDDMIHKRCTDPDPNPGNPNWIQVRSVPPHYMELFLWQ